MMWYHPLEVSPLWSLLAIGWILIIMVWLWQKENR